MVRIITDATEIPRDKKVVIDFFASWCGPCKTIAPYYEDLSQTFSDIVFLKADVDDFDDSAESFDIQALPTFVFLNKGVWFDTVKGADINKVMKMLGELEKA